jgi:hypothetical protein
MVPFYPLGVVKRPDHQKAVAPAAAAVPVGV